MPKARLQSDETILPSHLSRKTGSPPDLQVPPPLSRLPTGWTDRRLNGGDLFDLIIVKAMEIFDCLCSGLKGAYTQTPEQLLL